MDPQLPMPVIRDVQTKRLLVQHGSAQVRDPQKMQDLAARLCEILTPEVLEHLPPSLHVVQEPDAVGAWIKERSEESDVYLIKTAQPERMIGLLILVQTGQTAGIVVVHIGYLFAQDAWGQGYASELIAGLVQAAQTIAPVTLMGGVAVGNGASAHILRKQGFVVQPDLSDPETEVFAVTIEAG